MHRSGTSFVASWLDAAGVDMGEHLLAADAANRRGYFEDLDFLALQREMLVQSTPAEEESHPDWGWSAGERLDESRFADFREAARSLVAARAARPGPWGWKDPRVSVTLDFWDELLRGEGLAPRYVLVYRFPWEVADSMQRLGADVFLRHPEYALRIWSFYNRRLLAFRRRAPQCTLLVSANALPHDPVRFAGLVRDKLGMVLGAEPAAGLFERQLFAASEPDDPLIGLTAATSPAVVELLAELDREADLPATGLWVATRPLPRRGAAAPASVEKAPASAEAAPKSGAPSPASGEEARASAEAAPTSGAPAPVRGEAVELSVVIPCYNHGELLVEAVASFERSAPPAAELLVVNDGSTQPRTLAVLAALRAAGYRILDQPNGGLAAARNRGVESARGRYILPLDADNRLRPGFPAAALRVLDADEAVGVVYGDRCELGLRTGRVRVPELDLDRLLTGNYIDACAVYRRRIWTDCGGYDPAVPGWEDWELWISAAARGWRFHRLDAVTFDYRVRPDSMVAAFQEAKLGERLQRHIVMKHRELYLDRLPALLIAVQHGRPAAAGGLLVPALEEERLERARVALQGELDNLRAAREELAADIEEARQGSLAASSESQSARGEIAELRAAGERWQAEAASLRAGLDGLAGDLAACRDHVRFIEATRAWKLRRWLLRLRRRAD